MTLALSKKFQSLLFVLFCLGLAVCFPITIHAASLSVAPGTGVYKTGQSFTVNVVVNTAGVPVNAADGSLTFDPHELTVVGVNRASSIFNLWTAEPTFSNTAGTISFSGGVPTGYTGTAGVVMSVTVRAVTSGTAHLSISSASVLAADGRGTNVLTSMNGGTFTLAAVESTPAPEVIVEYVPPANTPAAPKISSPTHNDQTKWYTAQDATLDWNVPSDVIAVRTLIDTSPISVPTKVYDSPIKTLTLKNLDQGISYFHVQFKNKDGWGKVSNYRLAIDNVKPSEFSLALPEQADLSTPVQTINVHVTDVSSPVLKYKIQIDAEVPYEYVATSTISKLVLPSLTPGSHNVTIEAFDAAGNSLTSTLSFTISAFDKPTITEYPTRLNEGVIPVIKGTTRPRSLVTVTLVTPSGESVAATTTSTDSGVFTFIPAQAFTIGVYSISAVAVDSLGAASVSSDVVKVIVEKPGYIVIGSLLISVLSIIIPLIGICIFGWLLIMYGIHRARILRARIIRESGEATAMTEREFAAIRSVLRSQEQEIMQSRKTGKLTVSEAKLISEITAIVDTAERLVEKEVADVADVVRTK
jgi:hypothetical protein